MNVTRKPLATWNRDRASGDAIEARFRERAKNFDNLCEAAARSVSGIERTESRLATIESDMHVRLSQLSTDIQAVVGQLRGEAAYRPASLIGGAEAWPLEGVMRLHNDLRQSTESLSGLPPGHADSPALLTGE